MNDSYWWRLPVVSGAETDSGFSGDSGEYQARLEAAFGPTPELANAVFMGSGLAPQQPTPQGGPMLSAEDIETLEELDRQRLTILTQIIAVVVGETNAFFIWGPGGHGKSWLVRKALEQFMNRVRWTTTDVSAKGLFNLLKEFSTYIHVFEDMEKMYKQADCQAVLRAACGGQSIDERWVSWEKDGKYHEEPFQFAGGVIILSNEDPRGGSMKMGAIASRFAPQKWELTEAELAATMRDLAINTPCRHGYSVEERLEVAEFVIDEMTNRPAKVKVDLRTFGEHALPAYDLWRREGLSHWHDVVRAKIKGEPRRNPADIERERLMKAACEAHREGTNTEDRINRWKQKTGLGKSQFYEYLKMAKEAGMY
jgi:hypothetical protein